MNRKLKYIGIVALSAVFCIFLHFMIPPALTSETPQNTLSALALLLGFPVTALLWAGLAYSCVAFVFYLIEDRIPGERGARGFRYGISIGIIWLLGYIMCVPKFGNPFINEFVGGLCDAVPVVTMGWLLGLFTIKNDVTDTPQPYHHRRPLIGIGIFVLIFCVTRTVSYWTNILDIGFHVNHAYALGWTIAMGVGIGIVYLLMGQSIITSSTLVSAIKFGFLLFGLTWGIFIMFFPLMLKGEFLNTILMFLIDTLSVTAAYYVSEKLLSREQEVSHCY